MVQKANVLSICHHEATTVFAQNFIKMIQKILDTVQETWARNNLWVDNIWTTLRLLGCQEAYEVVDVLDLHLANSHIFGDNEEYFEVLLAVSLHQIDNLTLI